MSQKKIQELDSVRGLAALLVVLYHTPKWNPILNIGLIDNGYLMVDLFFVISGFVIYSAYAGRIKTTQDLKQFQFLRLGRLYPVHIVFLLAFLATETLKYITTSTGNVADVRSEAFSQNSGLAFLQHLLLAQGILPFNNVKTFNAPAWSISVEFYTYLLFGTFALTLGKLKNWAFGLTSLLSLAFIALDMHFGLQALLHCLAGFFLGCVIASFSTQVRLPRYTAEAAAVLAVLYFQLKSPFQYDLGTFFVSALLVYAISKNTGGILSNILNLRPLIWLGKMSYSIYMTHALVLWIAQNILKRVFKRPEIKLGEDIYAAALSVGETALACTLVLLAVFILSDWVYRKIESPWRQRSRGFVGLYRIKQLSQT